MNARTSFARSAAVLVVSGLVLAGCAHESPARTAERAHVVLSGMDAYPHEGLVDWVSYGDAVVTFEVLSETEIPVTPDEAKAGEGLIMRRIEAKVTKVVWSADASGRPLERLSFTTAGWTFDRTGRQPVSSGPVRPERGRSYLAPVAPTAEGAWAPIHPGEILAWVNDEVAIEAAGSERPSSEAASRLRGAGSSKIAGILRAVRPDPSVTRDRSLPPEQRGGPELSEGGG